MYNVFMCTENKLSVGSYQVPEEPDNYKGEENGELQRSVGMAKSNGDDKGDLSFSQKTSERGNVCAFGSDERRCRSHRIYPKGSPAMPFSGTTTW